MEERRHFLFEQRLAYVFQDPVGSLLTNMVCGFLLTVLILPVTDIPPLLAWLVLLLTVSLFRTVIGKKFHHDNEKSLKYYEQAYRIGTLTSAFVWAIPSILLFPGDFTHQLYMIAVLAGLLVGASQSQAPFPVLNTLYSVIVISPPIFRFLLSGRLDLPKTAAALLLWVLTINSRKIQRIITQSFELRYEISCMAITDPLTRLANRRRFDHVYDLEWQRARRRQSPISVLMIDVDYFKRYNDIYGHPAGDKCLKRIADAIGNALNRPTDIAARYGGEEFVVILPDTPETGARTVAEKIRAGIAGLGLPHEGNPDKTNMTVSVGLATATPTNDTCSDSLISAADTALYLAKARGRDRVEPFMEAN